MKKVFSFLAIISIILVSNCTQIPENDNPVIGIWSDVEVAPASLTGKSETVRKEWIFNDAYLGRYHRKSNGSITFKTDFKWSYENDTYTISYPGTDMESQIVSMKTSEEGNTLADSEGHTMALRE
ncbi:hypothetical protein D9V96_003115 [Zobellia laminariae]|uniref:hypothetical protein n=1 Tax=Zobellia laminariae TaxID=248906 RepID=UPI0012D888DE|nr:hypothetical protein [Zobellia laminariae]MUH38657.1 hypothetical protein [Zobellia laminariae]WKX74832.1 hypothetical protein Q5W13_13600 [Zobellia laminariae]